MGGLMAYLIKIIQHMGENVVEKIQMKTSFVYSPGGHQNQDVKIHHQNFWFLSFFGQFGSI